MFKQVFIPPELLGMKTSTSGFHHCVCLLIMSKKEMSLCNIRSAEQQPEIFMFDESNILIILASDKFSNKQRPSNGS